MPKADADGQGRPKWLGPWRLHRWPSGDVWARPFEVVRGRLDARYVEVEGPSGK